jgi:hypothetical protein
VKATMAANAIAKASRVAVGDIGLAFRVGCKSNNR